MKYLAILRGGGAQTGPTPYIPFVGRPVSRRIELECDNPLSSRVTRLLLPFLSFLPPPSFHPAKTIARARDTWSVDDRDRSTFLPSPPFFTGFDRSIRRPHLAPLGGNAAWKRKTAGWKSKSTSHRGGGGEQSGCGLSRAKIDDR